MHHDHIAALHVLRDLGFRLESSKTEPVEVSVHPPFTDLRTVQSVVEDRDLPIAIGAQHCSQHDAGAYTGEVSPAMLARLSVRYAIVGHSERRQLFGMSDETVAATLRAVIRHGMLPILCVGETEQQRDEGDTENVLASQLRAALGGLDTGATASLVIAYEPIWAIGTGRAATPDDAEQACGFVRREVASLAGSEPAGQVRIQYGGSVNPENAGSLVELPSVDGLLVGGASIEAGKFADIITAVAACYRAVDAKRGVTRGR